MRSVSYTCPGAYFAFKKQKGRTRTTLRDDVGYAVRNKSNRVFQEGAGPRAFRARMVMKTVARYSPITFPVTKDGGRASLVYTKTETKTQRRRIVLAKPTGSLEYVFSLLAYLHTYIRNREKETVQVTFLFWFRVYISRLTIKVCLFFLDDRKITFAN